LLGYQNSNIAQEQVAQAIFGGIGMSGKIPVSTKYFEINSGINTNALRMAYVSAEEIGFNTEFLYKIDSIAKNAIAEKAIPGCQILIAKEGKIFFNKSYGYHTYDEKIVVKNSDVYDVASITKIASTIPILMQMVDEGSLNIDDELGKYLDLDSTNKEHLIIREILAHQSGLYPWIPFYKQTLVKDSISGLMQLRDTLYSEEFSKEFPIKVADNIYLQYSYPDSIIQQIIASKSLDKQEYRYSDLGYYLLKKIIEKKYGKAINNIVADEFYSKLGMESLGYLPLSRVSKDRIVPTEDDFLFRSQLLQGYVHDMGAAMQGGVGGHAGLFSNANDLAKLMQMYLQNGEYAGERYLSEEVVKEFTKCQFPKNKNRRGAGFDKAVLANQKGGPASENANQEGFGHTGFTGTLVWADPKNQIVYVFLSNRIHPDATNKKLLTMDVRTNIMEVIFKSIND
jgi:beta-N-acetylhexosaminidase